MNEKGSGLLAIWSTVAGDFETDYLHWLTREHVFERVGTQGFRTGCVYRRRDSSPSEYLILYTLDDASVMASDAYRARLNNPTAWSQRVMPQLQHFRRGGGEVIAHAGHADAMGAHMAVARFEAVVPTITPGVLDAITALDRVSRIRVMSVASDATAISTREKSMRTSSEGTFAGIIAIEALDDTSLHHAVATLNRMTMIDFAFQNYKLVFSHSKTVGELVGVAS